MKTENKRFIVKESGAFYVVFDTILKDTIGCPCPKDVAESLCDDHNKMQKDIKTEPFGNALVEMKDGYKVKRKCVLNDTVIIIHKNELMQMSESSGVRYPYSPTNEDLLAEDWVILIK